MLCVLGEFCVSPDLVEFFALEPGLRGEVDEVFVQVHPGLLHRHDLKHVTVT